MMRTRTPSCKTGTSLDVFVRACLVKGWGWSGTLKFYLLIHQAMPRKIPRGQWLVFRFQRLLYLHPWVYDSHSESQAVVDQNRWSTRQMILSRRTDRCSSFQSFGFVSTCFCWVINFGDYISERMTMTLWGHAEQGHLTLSVPVSHHCLNNCLPATWLSSLCISPPAWLTYLLLSLERAWGVCTYERYDGGIVVHHSLKQLEKITINNLKWN